MNRTLNASPRNRTEESHQTEAIATYVSGTKNFNHRHHDQ